VSHAQLQPPCLPISLRPLDIVAKQPKSLGGPLRFRNIVNHSSPATSLLPARSNADRMGARSETGAFHAPNHNVDVPAFTRYSWLDINDVGTSVDVVCELGEAAGFDTYGGCYDFMTWFRQLPLRIEDRWLTVPTFRGSFFTDRRMAMGGSSSADAAMRPSNILDANSPLRPRRFL